MKFGALCALVVRVGAMGATRNINEIGGIMSVFEVINVLDIVDMIVDFEEIPLNGRTVKLRNEIRYKEYDLYLGEPGALKRLEEAVKAYYQYGIECRKKAQYETEI